MVLLRDFTTYIPQPVRFGLRRAFFSGAIFSGAIFSGQGTSCPLCGTTVRGFRAHGGGAPVLEARRVAGGMRREADRCPVCHGADRTRMMMLWLEAVGGVGTRPLKVLHVAPDFGLYLWLKRQPGVEYTGSDLDAARYRHIPDMQVADLTATPFETGRFDIVICSHVLEHVPDDRAAFAEILRILRPGGRALLLTPFALDGRGTDEDPAVEGPAERKRRFGQWDHVRLYDRGDFLRRMAAAGFATALFEPFASHPGEAGRLHLNPLEALPVGTRPAAA